MGLANAVCVISLCNVKKRRKRWRDQQRLHTAKGGREMEEELELD